MLVGRMIAVVCRLVGSSAAAKSGDLDGFRAEHHVHQAKTAADDARASENRAHFLGRGAGRHVVVLGDAAQQQIAHRAADHVSGVPMLLQRFAGLHRAAAHVVARDAVGFKRYDPGLRGLEQRARKNLAEKPPDH